MFMFAEPVLCNLIHRVQHGDEEAATELVRLCEPEILRYVRIRLAGSSLRRLLDPQDISQLVLARFFAYLASGRIDIQHPNQLWQLLRAMARNRLNDQLRKQRAQRRDSGPLISATTKVLASVASRCAVPSETLATRDLLAVLCSRLSEQERYWARQRMQGHGWVEIAAECGDSPDNVRKRLTRAFRRVARDLGIEDQEENASAVSL
jgi:RNA polymerase sigma factor (sigma-70 family)